MTVNVEAVFVNKNVSEIRGIFLFNTESSVFTEYVVYIYTINIT